MRQEVLPQEIIEVPSNPPNAIGRPRRATRKTDRYGHNICERIENETAHLQPGICLQRQISRIADTNVMGKPTEVVASQPYPRLKTGSSHHPQVRSNTVATCQGHAPFPVENSTREYLSSLSQQSYISNYYHSPPVTHEMEGKSNNASIGNSLVNQSYDIDTNKSESTPISLRC